MKFVHRSFVLFCLLLLVPLTTNAALRDDLQEVSGTAAPSFDNVQWLHQTGDFPDSLKGKVLLVNFWATWCPPCVEELPSIQNARDTFDQSHFEVVSVNVGEKVADIKAFLETLPVKLTFPIVVDEKLSAYAEWRVSPLPTTFLVDRVGKIRYQALGGRNFASANIRAIIQELIDE